VNATVLLLYFSYDSKFDLYPTPIVAALRHLYCGAAIIMWHSWLRSRMGRGTPAAIITPVAIIMGATRGGLIPDSNHGLPIY
jgi:hypothetical protein